METIIIGVDHCYDREKGLEELITKFAESESVVLIGEERPGQHPLSAAQKVAKSREIPWIQIDMSTGERIEASIHNRLATRMDHYPVVNGIPVATPCYAPEEDGKREYFWLDQIQKRQMEGVVIVVCGWVHAKPLADKAKARGHNVIATAFYPENCSERSITYF